MKHKLFIVCAVAATLAVACTSTRVDNARARLDTADATLAETRARSEALRFEAEARGDTATASAAAKATAEIDEIAAKSAAVRAAIEAAVGPDGSIGPEGVIGAAAPFLPPPWNVLLLVGGPLLTYGAQQLRVRREAAKVAAEAAKVEAVEKKNQKLYADTARIVNSIDVLRNASPEVGAAITQHKKLLHEWQGADGVALVREIRNS